MEVATYLLLFVALVAGIVMVFAPARRSREDEIYRTTMKGLEDLGRLARDFDEERDALFRLARKGRRL